MKQRIALLGSTGSIGVQTLDIVRENPDFFEVRVLTANSNWQRLAAQAREFDADTAVIADKRYYTRLRDALEDTDVKVYAGEEAVAQVAAGGDTDVAVNALVGYAGWTPEFSCVLPHRYARLEDLAVDEAVRGEGVGGELLAAAKRWARNRRLEYLELNVLAQNENAIRLYESQDFVEATKVMRCML